MEGYQGEFAVNILETPFADYKKEDWAMYYIGGYGQIDGAHHKQWVLDQVARILKGTKVIIKEARWDNGFKDYRTTLEDPSEEYKKWVEEMKRGEYDDEYDYEEGVAP